MNSMQWIVGQWTVGQWAVVDRGHRSYPSTLVAGENTVSGTLPLPAYYTTRVLPHAVWSTPGSADEETVPKEGLFNVHQLTPPAEATGLTADGVANILAPPISATRTSRPHLT